MKKSMREQLKQVIEENGHIIPSVQLLNQLEALIQEQKQEMLEEIKKEVGNYPVSVFMELPRQMFIDTLNTRLNSLKEEGKEKLK